MTRIVSTPRMCRVWRDLEPSIKEAAPRLCRSPAAILDPGLEPARSGNMAGTEERPFSPDKGTVVCSDLPWLGETFIGLSGPGERL